MSIIKQHEETLKREVFMSNWRLCDFFWRSQPEIWAFDLGKIEEFVPTIIPQNRDEPFHKCDSFVRTEDGSYLHGFIRPQNFRIAGWDCLKMNFRASESEPLRLSDSDTGKLNLKGHNGPIFYKDEKLNIICCDPRVIAIDNLQFDARRFHIPYKEIGHIFERVPTREAAIKYLELNGIPFDEPLSDAQVAKIPQEKYFAQIEKQCDYTPLLEGLEH